MITNLFSIFDPSLYILSIGWIIPIIAISTPILIVTSKYNQTFIRIINIIYIEIKTLSARNYTASFLTPLFIIILILNLISIIPTVFTINSQISIVLPIGLAIWLRIVIYSLYRKINKFLAHLVPEGSPISLTPILVIIELTRNIIRPITLSVRLIANITAGHLLIHLLRSFVCYIYPFSFIMIPVSLILSSLELIVAFIQAYIFCALLSLYSNEIH